MKLGKQKGGPQSAPLSYVAWLRPLLLGRPGVLERDRAVEDQLARRALLGIEAEVAEALELVAQLGLGGHERRLQLRGDDLQRARVDVLFEITVGVRLRDG